MVLSTISAAMSTGMMISPAPWKPVVPTALHRVGRRARIRFQLDARHEVVERVAHGLGVGDADGDERKCPRW